MEPTRGMASVMIFMGIMMVATSRPSDSLANFILNSYQRHLLSDMRQAMSLKPDQSLPEYAVALMQEIQRIQLPTVLNTMKNGLNSGEIKNIGEDLDNAVKTLVSNLHLKEIFAQDRPQIKRDDEDLMPNMLNQYYGGFGK